MPTSGQSGWSRLYPDPSKALTLGNSGNNENFASPPVETALPSPPPLWGLGEADWGTRRALAQETEIRYLDMPLSVSTLDLGPEPARLKSLKTLMISNTPSNSLTPQGSVTLNHEVFPSMVKNSRNRTVALFPLRDTSPALSPFCLLLARVSALSLH